MTRGLQGINLSNDSVQPDEIRTFALFSEEQVGFTRSRKIRDAVTSIEHDRPLTLGQVGVRAERQ